MGSRRASSLEILDWTAFRFGFNLWNRAFPVPVRRFPAFMAVMACAMSDDTSAGPIVKE
jgi:hypothetical protein